MYLLSFKKCFSLNYFSLLYWIMEFKKPKPKKNSTPKGKLMLPLKNEKEIVGVFNGQFVTVYDWDSMNYLYESGNFGKGTLSKGQPSYHITKDDISKIMVQHQFENHVKWNTDTRYSYAQKYLGFARNDLKLSLQSVSQFLESTFDDDDDAGQEKWKSWKEKHKLEQKSKKLESLNQKVNWSLVEFKTDKPDFKDEIFISLVHRILQSRQIKMPTNKISTSEEVIVLNISFDSHLTDLSLTNTNAALKKLPFALQENLNLSLEESFFLKSVLGCLNIVDLNFSEIAIPDLWKRFNLIDKNFTERYITYNYYRKKGWIVRSGLKFGGDYLLYKDGPASYHASYLVKVLDRRKKLTWRDFIAMNRLVETFNKDLLLCHIRYDEEVANKETYANELTSHSVQEVLVRRWFPSKERSPQGSTSN